MRDVSEQQETTEEQGTPPRRRRRLTGLQPLVVGVAAALVVGFGAGLGSGALAWHGGSSAQAASSSQQAKDKKDAKEKVEGVDSSPEQKARLRSEAVPAAVAELKDSGFKPVHQGQLTVAATSGSAPLVFHASDGSTVVGSEIDVAQLIADGLDLKLKVETTNWADWPLGVQSGKYDLVVSNVGVTEERKDLFDFATYRRGLHGFLVRQDSGIDSIESAGDIAGKKIVVGSGTNQEKILQAWNASNEKAGKKPAELVYYDDNAAGVLALKSQRVDATFGPNPAQIYESKINPELKTVGPVNAGWPENSDVDVATAKGNGLVEPVATVLEADLQDGVLKKSQERWGLGPEVIGEIQINPKGLPRETK